MIYIAPDRTSYTNLPPHICTSELEPLTGADMLISNFPIEMINESTLQAHIQSRALFVQIKIGYDVLSFDGLHNFCARVQKCKIPKSQAILLQIGEYWQDENGLLRLKGSKPYGNTTWRDYRKALIGCELRGVTVFPETLSSMGDLPGWIEDYQTMIQKVTSESKRQIYPHRPTLQFEPEDIWQEVEEVDRDSPEYFIYGLNGCGPQIIQNTKKYATTNFPHIPIDGYYLLKILTDQNEKGKAIHNVKGVGEGLRKKWRKAIGLQNGINLGIIGTYQDGWYTALKVFRGLVEGEKLSAKDAFNATMALVTKEVIRLPGDEIEF